MSRSRDEIDDIDEQELAAMQQSEQEDNDDTEFEEIIANRSHYLKKWTQLRCI